MVIKSHASSGEASSPFYIANEKLCKEFERYVGTKNGLIKGNFNATSYYITAKISSKKEWVLKYNKATFSSSGNLLLSSKKQCLRVTCSWSSIGFDSESAAFRIRKKNFTDSMFGQWKSMRPYSYYSIKTNELNSKLLLDVKNILNDLLIERQVLEIEYINGKLKIEIDSEDLHTEIIDKLLHL